MRVITGTQKGKHLITPNGLDVRPTTDKIKESIFNMLQFELYDCHFLDLFAGTGQMGIEALSRGASCATFVDNSRSSINVVKKNILLTNLVGSSRIYNMEAGLFLKKNTSFFDIAFLDPPYNMGILPTVLPLLVKFINKDGYIICESSIDTILPERVENFIILKKHTYGKILITIYRHMDVV